VTVTVVIPVHNGEAYLGDAVESVLAQTQGRPEIVVVDDGSTDGTARVAEGFGDALLYITQPNGGPASAMNRGAAQAQGEYLSFLSADDVWAPEKLARQLAALRESDADLVFGHVEHFLSPELDTREAAGLNCPAEPMPATSAGTMLTRLETFRHVGPFDDRLRVGEFMDWYSRATEAGLEALVLPEVVSRRRVHGGNHSLRSRAPLSYAAILKANLDRRRAAAGDAAP
jgi:glycosyltransferase involved in cell wall biosynthesis